jgi:hypothetical protein
MAIVHGFGFARQLGGALATLKGPGTALRVTFRLRAHAAEQGWSLAADRVVPHPVPWTSGWLARRA